MVKQGGRGGTAMDPKGILEGMPGVNDSCGNNSPPVVQGSLSKRPLRACSGGQQLPLMVSLHAGCELARNNDHL